MQRRALVLLFSGLAAGLAAIAAAALAGAGNEPRGWIVAAAALAVSAWLGSLAFGTFRRRR